MLKLFDGHEMQALAPAELYEPGRQANKAQQRKGTLDTLC